METLKLMIGLILMLFYMAYLIYRKSDRRTARLRQAKEQERAEEEKRRKQESQEQRKLIDEQRAQYKAFLEGEGRIPEQFALTDNPFEQFLENVGPDGLRNHSGVSCWLKMVEETALDEAIAAIAAWKLKHLEYFRQQDQAVYLWPRYCEGRIVILLSSRDAWKDLDEQKLQLCQEAWIRFAVVQSESSLFDLQDQTEYQVRTEEWPGSVDDAATYGEWSLY